ncbi:MAG: flavin reductase [Planctomycetota bacterium]
MRDDDDRGHIGNHEGATERVPAADIPASVIAALPRLATGMFVMTAKYEDCRSGARVFSVQQCASSPLLIAIALRKGHVVETLIRDSHAFALCEIDPADRLCLRKFPDRAMERDEADPRAALAAEHETDGVHDPFDAIATRTLRTGAPVLARSPLVLDCEVVRHFDLEADHELYVGLVLGGVVPSPAGVNGCG